MGMFDMFKKKTFAPQKIFICARCKKEITDEESKWIGNHRFCSVCAAPPQKATIKSHLEAEAKETEYQAHIDYERGSLTLEQAYSNRGFVKDKDSKWVYGKLEHEERLKQQEHFRKLTIKEQLSELENKIEKRDCVIGEIYIPQQFLELNNRQENKKILSSLLGMMKCVKDYGIMGMGDVEFRWLFEKDDLLIGIYGTSNRGGPILVAGNYKVYRFSKESTASIDDVEKLLF